MIETLKPGVVYFVIVFSIAFIFGIISTLFLVPRIGERWAELPEIPFLLIVILFTARWIARKFEPRPA